MAIWGTGFGAGDEHQNETGDADSVAPKTTANPVEFWYKWANNGVTWPADSSAVLIGNVGVSTYKVPQVNRDAQRVLYVTNGYDKNWKSEDNGKTWVAI